MVLNYILVGCPCQLNPRPTAQQISRSPNWANHAAVLCWIAQWHNFEFARSRVDLALPLRCDDFRSFWITSFEFVKFCWIRFFSWESFIGFYVWCYPISTILVCLFIGGVRSSWKKLCWKGSMLAEMPSRASYLVTVILYGGWIWANYHETEKRKTTNCTLTF